jgi:hypothetical protein
MRRLILIAVCVISAIFLLFVVGDISTKIYLRTHAVQFWGCQSRDGKFLVVMYRYPQLRDIPESLGFGQGFVQLQDTASGKVLAEKHADDLAPLTAYKWSSTNVIIYRTPGASDVFVNWDLPKLVPPTTY